MRPIPLVAALLLTASIARAVEHDAELRVTIGMAPGIDKVKSEDSHNPAGAADPGNDGEVDFDAKYGFAFEPSIMFHTTGDGFGLVGGPLGYFDVVRGTHSLPGVEFKRKLTTYGLGVEFGPSFQADWFRLEILPFIGGGFAHAKAEGTSGPIDRQIDSQDGWSFEYGVRGGVYAASDQGLVGVQLGFQAFQAHVNFPAKAQTGTSFDDSRKETLSGAGLSAAFVAGVAF